MSKTTTDSRNDKAGLPPGALIHIGKRFTEQAKISVIDYTNNQFIKTELTNVSEAADYINLILFLGLISMDCMTPN